MTALQLVYTNHSSRLGLPLPQGQPPQCLPMPSGDASHMAPAASSLLPGSAWNYTSWLHRAPTSIWAAWRAPLHFCPSALGMALAPCRPSAETCWVNKWINKQSSQRTRKKSTWNRTEKKRKKPFSKLESQSQSVEAGPSHTSQTRERAPASRKRKQGPQDSRRGVQRSSKAVTAPRPQMWPGSTSPGNGVLWWSSEKCCTLIPLWEAEHFTLFFFLVLQSFLIFSSLIQAME